MTLKSLPPWRVLVFPGGTEIGLEINRALRDCKEVQLFAAGQDVPSASEFCFRSQFYLPPITAPGWLDELRSLVSRLAIDCIYPAHDDVVLALARNQPEISVPVMGSSLEVCEIARSKSSTYGRLHKYVPTPVVYQTNDTPSFPVFVKPDRGQGSQGARRIDNRADLTSAIRKMPELLVSEFLPGTEYTVDCFSSSRHGLVFAQARERIRTRAGIAMQSRLVHDPEFHAHAASIARSLPFRGAWFFQMKRDVAGQLRLLEVAPRIAGTMALTRVTGLNFPLMTLYDAAGYDVRPIVFGGNVELSRSLENHYRLDFSYSTVYVDLDDTLVLRETVNTRLVRFIYQCINQHKPVVLVTRHRKNLSETLRRHRLDGLFDRIHHLDESTCKSTVIKEADAILIDDSFRERLTVSAALGIRTFDPCAIECLIDSRS